LAYAADFYGLRSAARKSYDVSGQEWRCARRFGPLKGKGCDCTQQVSGIESVRVFAGGIALEVFSKRLPCDGCHTSLVPGKSIAIVTCSTVEDAFSKGGGDAQCLTCAKFEGLPSLREFLQGMAAKQHHPAQPLTASVPTCAQQGWSSFCSLNLRMTVVHISSPRRSGRSVLQAMAKSPLWLALLRTDSRRSLPACP
jgi:hypothetical protein